MPYGLVDKLEKEEVKEQLYYIKIPYINSDNPSKYINLWENGVINISDIIDLPGKKTEFTLEEVKEKYPLFANDNFLVKVEDVWS